MTTDPILLCERLTFRYPQAAAPALREVSLRVQRGAFALLVGPSGAGKSTLLRCFNGLVPHFSGGEIGGRVLVDGLDPIQAGPQRMSRRVGFVFQDPEAQFAVGRVEDEIAFVLENAAFPRPEMRRRVEQALDWLGLRALRRRDVRTLSGGEQQRAAIAAALVLRPALLALDEPTSQLDPQSAAGVLEALRRLNRRLGLTILLAEHRLERVLPLADYLAVLDADGRLRWQGPVDEGLPYLPWLPPVTDLGRRLGWTPWPRSVEAARSRLAGRRCKSRPAPPAAQTAPVLLRAEALRAGYDSRPVLRDVSLSVRGGEILALLGRNGSGKTTLLKALMGLIRPQGGAVYLDGRRADGWSTAQRARRAAYLPQDPNALLFSETVLEELALTRRNHGLPVNEPALRALLRRLGLARLADAYPRDLSAGERQRVALGAVTVTRPQALLLDEPTRGLDGPSRRALASLLRAWRADGMGILLVTHDVELVARLADRAALLEAGRIQAEGRLEGVFGAYPEFAPQIFRLLPPCLTAAEAAERLSAAP